MSDNKAAEDPVAPWLQPLTGAAAPCGADLENDNRFLEMTLAAAGKPDDPIGKIPAVPPDWRQVRRISEGLMALTRDLRIAVLWARAGLYLEGFVSIGAGLRLVCGLVDTMWEKVHPLPDPDDGDPYARVNALTLLRETQGLLGDLRASHLVRDRAIGELTVRQLEIARGLAQPGPGETDVGAAVVTRMLEAACEANPGLRTSAEQAVEATRRLGELMNEKLRADAPDVKPLQKLLDAVLAAMPAPPPPPVVEEAAEEGAAGQGGGGAAGGGGARVSRGLTGTVTSREEAIRAIDLACQYLERFEPSNPATLFLRRGRQMMDQNFLQLVQLLAPGAVAEVAKLVGVDPESLKKSDGKPDGKPESPKKPDGK